VRFWAKSLTQAQAGPDTPEFWLNTDRPDPASRVIWVGAATKDTGFSLTSLTFQITHATDANTNTEREFLVAALEACGGISDVTLYDSGDELAAEAVNHYVTDGDIAVALLANRNLRDAKPQQPSSLAVRG
jgi:hypothetical protein